jgi:hypothetical protein
MRNSERNILLTAVSIPLVGKHRAKLLAIAESGPAQCDQCARMRELTAGG